MQNISVYYTIVSLLSLLLGGCAVKTTPPIDHYTLQMPPAPVSSPTGNFRTMTLKIKRPESIRQICSTRIHYAFSPLERESYAYSRWSDTPNALIAAYLRTLLLQSPLFNAVVSDSSSARSDLTLESQIEAFYQRFESGTKAYAILQMHFILIDTETKKVIAKRGFTEKVPSPTPDAGGAAKAFSEAVKLMGKELEGWLSERATKGR